MNDPCSSDVEDAFVLQSVVDFVGKSTSTSSINSMSDESRDGSPERRKIPKMENYDDVKKLDDVDFKRHFRLSRKVAYSLASELESTNILPMHSKGREKISAEKAMLIALWYLANRNSFREISDRFGISYSAAHTTLKRVIYFLIKFHKSGIKWPSPERRAQIREKLSLKAGLPGAIGIIGGSHIEIAKPRKNQDSYVNRKGYHSILLQGVVDHEKYFIDVFCGEPGSIHDSRLLRKSSLYNKIISDPHFMKNYFLYGDCGYPNSIWLVTPFRDTGFLTRQQHLFNTKLSSKRVIVEQSFGLLKNRFRRLISLENLDISFCTKLLMACCILHNICLADDGSKLEETEAHDEENNRPSAIITLNENNTMQQNLFSQMFP